jgi:hypothetical protein
MKRNAQPSTIPPTPHHIISNMPAVSTNTNTSASTGKKVQPWRSVWPAAESTANNQYERQAAATQGLNGQYGFNEKGEGVAPKK